MNLQELREAYKVKTGKNPFLGWNETQLAAKLEESEPKKVEEKQAEPVESTEIDRITRLEKMVEQLSVENTNLRQETAKLQEGWADYTPPTKANKTATLKVYRKDADSPAGVVVKCYTFKNNAFNEETRKNDKVIFTVTLRYDDNTTEELKMDALDFTKIREIEKVEIVKENTRTLRKVEDYIVAPERDREGYPKRVLDGGTGYGRNIGSNQVPLEVFMVKSIVTVKRKNGQEFEMDGDFLNL